MAESIFIQVKLRRIFADKWLSLDNCFSFLLEYWDCQGVGELTQWLKAHSALAEDLSWVTNTQVYTHTPTQTHGQI